MVSKIKSVISFLGGFLGFINRSSEIGNTDKYKIQCENCGHIDLYDNFEPSNDSCYSFFCPSCDDWTYECAVE